MAVRALVRYLVLSVLLPVMASGVHNQVLYRQNFDSNDKCLGRPSETFPVAIIDRCFVSCEGGSLKRTMDAHLCGPDGLDRWGEWCFLLSSC